MPVLRGEWIMLKLLVALILSLAQPSAGPIEDYTTATRPSIAPVSWELKFRFQDPQRVSVIVPGQKEPVLYWYMLYTVENPGRSDVEYLPHFELVTDTLKVIRSEVRVSPEAFQAIKRRSNDPLLLPPEKIVGTLQHGADRARHGVAIFKDFDPKAKAFTIYVSGLSGEVKRVKNPGFDKSKPEGPDNLRYLVLRKTLAIPYRFPGSESVRTQAMPERVVSSPLKWVMR
ncbi:MAG TPA: hypothetical protein PKG54_03970 [Phycisphaerae bacterium]|nr:hypothetical protein [Phycisphaerae bacterium]HOB73661.1 hypothetical protein [Phycisphaerae bacterium]HOJ54734.1 hypothetical protein [Phycisphaerae bacterium]HOL25915.1 hypothetical protein [Phycisphaerae bacterium]HPP21153.1 hypothetical protein [Phycisphaerae bacterium]